ncbi:Lysine exporter protein (LYSE/YGGA) [Actinobacteria bacterium OK074]|nr:Lysine exporter protein (LYSE/YGGA) [Actinobacteria bacterium OK074]
MPTSPSLVSPDHLLAFAAMSFVLIVIPGPSVLFVIGRALAQGRRAALTTVVGNTLGAYVLVVAVALGIGSVVEESVLVFTALKLAGAAYLIYLGVKAWRSRGSLREAFAEGGVVERGSLRTLGEGVVVGISNPKTIVFFAAVLPQFVDRERGHVVAQMLLLGLVFNVIALVSDSLWGVLAATARGWFARSPRRLSAVGGVGGLAMIGLGVTVAATGRKD